MIKKPRLWQIIVAFAAANLFLFVFIAHFHNLVRFNDFNYQVTAHHYYQDHRAEASEFQLIRALGQYDAQWYLKIADSGYPSHPPKVNLQDKDLNGDLTYAFFPLYPLTVKLIDITLRNTEVSAFVLMCIVGLGSFLSLFIVVKRLFDRNLALKTSLLLFFFPFSIYLRSYFTEGLALLLLVWFAYFLIKQKWFPASIFLGGLLVIKGSFLPFVPLFLVFLLRAWRQKRISFTRIISLMIVSTLPFALWLGFNYLQTGNPVYFLAAQNGWFQGGPLNPLRNIVVILGLFSSVIPWHDFHYSKLDSLTAIIVGLLLWRSRKTLPKELWWISLLILVTPLIAKDTMSLTRYQIISFPLFLYVAKYLKGWKYNLVLGLSFTGLLIVSLYFVNWYWLG